jgi:hypothetical protein
MSESTPSRFAWWSAATIFLGAFLLFQVQPIISKMILPWFGGGPAVWTTCMLFFQVLLLGGYAYAHYLAAAPSLRWQTIIHVVILVVAAFTLPITPASSWKPTDGTQPTFRILILLAANVGLPYFILSSTGPLVQAWFARFYPDRSPYRLYALSNIGSLGALLTYPFFVEPALTTNSQGAIWSVGFAIYAVLCASLAVVAGRRSSSEVQQTGAVKQPSAAASEAAAETSDEPLLEHRLAWLVLPALASLMLLAITNHVCQDIAVVPFFWVVPLSLYLLSFIICFDHEFWYRRRIFGFLTGAAVFGLCVLMMGHDIDALLEEYGITSWLKKGEIEFEVGALMSDLVAQVAVYMAVLFLICMLCHGELVRCKPAPRYLTSFYLMISAGGAVGGLLVALICPQIFSSFIERGIGLVAAFMLAVWVLSDEFWTTWVLNHLLKKCAAFMFTFGLLLLVVRAQFEIFAGDDYLYMRNFYGILVIDEDNQDDDFNHIIELMNGRILHGSQFQDPVRSQEPTTYYSENSGVGITLNRYPAVGPKRVATVGLGTGTIAAYAQDGDYYCFYEINPNVPELATTVFTYISDARERGATIDIELGDARISMESEEPPRQYDIIALDAFSGDAIPAHLLTKEAFEEYQRHLVDGGVIAVHTSNRHLDLEPVVGGLAEHFGIPIVLIDNNKDDYVGDATSDWLLLTHNEAFLNDIFVIDSGLRLTPDDYQKIPLWTDQSSNLFQILDKPKWMTKFLDFVKRRPILFIALCLAVVLVVGIVVIAIVMIIKKRKKQTDLLPI